MPDYLEGLIESYRSKGILLDANVLLLLFIGSYNPARISTFKRTRNRGYSTADFELLVTLLSRFKLIATTPNILTEISNFTNTLLARDAAYTHIFQQYVSKFDETYIASQELCALPHFRRFGLTDTGIANVASGKYLVLTDDFKLAGYLAHQGTDAINFNHIRTLNWQ